MLSKKDFIDSIVSNINDPVVLKRYQADDPIVCMQLKSIASYFALLSQDLDIASQEPFIKAKDGSILADASNKGILPLATACKHNVEIINSGDNPVTLSQGREIEDNSGGRMWRLLQSVTIQPKQSITATVEQNEYREISYTIPQDEPFHKVKIDLLDGMHLTTLSLRDTQKPSNIYDLKPKWFNVKAGDYTATITTNDYNHIYIEFGDSERTGRTVQAGEKFIIGITESYGSIETSKLKDAQLAENYTTDESKIGIKFKQGEVIKNGADPLNISQLRLLASYPSLYDENAVYLGEFDFLIRKKFMNRCYFISVWNETIHERYFGADLKNINRLNIAFVPMNASEKDLIQQEMQNVIAYADSLYSNRIVFHDVEDVPFNIQIDGRVSAVHDIEQAKEQIIGLLVDKYGKNTIKASQWLSNGFNTQEMSTLIRHNITAFNDSMSDFSIRHTHQSNKPNQWTFVTKETIQIDLQRSAETVGNAWLN